MKKIDLLTSHSLTGRRKQCPFLYSQPEFELDRRCSRVGIGMGIMPWVGTGVGLMPSVDGIKAIIGMRLGHQSGVLTREVSSLRGLSAYTMLSITSNHAHCTSACKSYIHVHVHIHIHVHRCKFNFHCFYHLWCRNFTWSTPFLMITDFNSYNVHCTCTCTCIPSSIVHVHV